MKKFSAILVVLGLGLSLQAETGSSESEAREIEVSAKQFDSNVTLVKGEDEWWSGGVYYFKATLTKGKSYTVWYGNYDADEIGLDAYAGGDGFDGPWASFSSPTKQGSQYVCWLQASDWDSDDPSSWPFYFCLDGAVGARTQFHIVEGIKSFLDPGLSDNPTVLTFSDKEKSSSYTITEEGSYYFQASLAANRKYRIRTTTGTAQTPVALKVESGSAYAYEDDPDYAADKSNAAYVIYPKQSGTFTFVAYGPAVGKSFGIAYKSVPARAIDKHPVYQLTDGVTQTFNPGRLVADAAYYDDIPDERLFRFTVTKGDCWIIDAAGADRDIEMRLYNSSGTLLKTGSTLGDGTHDVFLSNEFGTSGTYYVGVFDPALSLTSTVVCAETGITARLIAAEEDVPEAIPVAAASSEFIDPLVYGAVSGPYTLDESHWTRTLTISGRKGVTYRFAVSQDDFTWLKLKVTVFRYSGSREIIVGDLEDIQLVPNVMSLSFDATENATYGIRLSVYEGEGLEFPPFNMHALGESEDMAVGQLTVRTRGAEGATWSLDSESIKYASGDSVLLPTNETYTVKFSKVSGFSKPADAKGVTVNVTEPTVVVGTYSDTYDPKDDVYTGATKLSVSAKETYAARPLWGDDGTGEVADEADWFTVTAKDGIYYNFELEDLEGDAVISIYRQVGSKPGVAPVDGAAGVTNVSKLVLGAGTFYLCVKHGTEANADSSYTLASSSANVGSIKFSKTSYSAKKNAGSVKVTVNRTAKEGRVRVRYATVAGTAQPGVRYVAQSGVLEWADGDSKAKDITIKLIPDLVAVYEGDTEFQLVLEPFGEDELADDEYPAQITADTCTVKVTESASKTTKTIEDAYAKTLPKVATVSKDEDTALRAGTFFGVLAEDGSALTNGLPQLASVTLTTTLKTGKPDSLSAKVALAGKTYAFKSDTKNPEEWEDVGDGYKRIVLTLVNKSPASTNELVLTVKDGWTTDEDAWLKAGGIAELLMTVPDAKGKGGQPNIRYLGEIYRQNAKIGDYLAKVAETFYGYYTLALVPDGVSSADGIPAGNGYLTVKVDNKGTATVSGLLADNTKISCKVTAAAIREDDSSANGYAMYLPVYQAKSPYCFGGTVKLTAKAGTTLPNDDFVRVVDSTATLVWNNDNAALTYYNEAGWRISCAPVGGWYDTIVNLEAYYLGYALSVGTADISEFPTELLTEGYDFVTDVQPNGEAASFANDVLSTAKRSLVKDGTLYDLVSSVNPCNVQVKLARATGIVTGSFSLWSYDGAADKQKEITGAKHNGVLLLSRDDFGALGDAVSAGFCTASVTLKEVNDKGKTVSRKWSYSLPFNLLGLALDEDDPWAEDKGWNPEWGENPDGE